MPKPFRVVVVEWVDASFESDTRAVDELDPLVTLRTVGWLVRQDAESVTVAQEWCERAGTVRHSTHIPRVGILSLRGLKVPGKRRKRG